MTNATATKPTTKRPRKMAREPKSEVTAVAAAATGLSAVATSETPIVSQPALAETNRIPKPTSKANQVIEMLKRPEGATIEQLVAATGWLPHTTRAVLTGLKKKGHAVTSDKIDGTRRYRIVGIA